MTYDLFKPCDFYLPVPIAMRQEEQQALDLLNHLLMPEVVVETGTWHGGSAWIWSQHCRVISIDPNPMQDFSPFEGRPITFVNAHAPDELDRVLEHVKGKRWLFFHDSLHFKKQLLEELAWARRNGAIAGCWHDVALNEGWCGPDQTMPAALTELQDAGFLARRMQHFGLDEVVMGKVDHPDDWQGIGFCWFR